MSLGMDIVCHELVYRLADAAYLLEPFRLHVVHLTTKQGKVVQNNFFFFLNAFTVYV